MCWHNNRNLRKELIYNCGSVQITLPVTDPNSTPEQIKDILFCNHLNLKTPSQRMYPFDSIQQNLTKLCRLTTTDMYHCTNWQTPKVTSQTHLYPLAVPTMLTPCMGSWEMNWKEGSNRIGWDHFKMHLKVQPILSPESWPNSGSTSNVSMKSTT